MGNTNERKTLAPLYIYLILKHSPGRPFKQQEIINRLRDYPYCIEKIERKAIGRILNTLRQGYVGIVSSKEGVYYDKNTYTQAETCDIDI